MLNLDQYNCLGAALREALDRWPNETCLIESDRDKEKTRLTYSDFKEMAMPMARALEARSVAVLIFMPTPGTRLHEAANTRSPSISTMQARQLPSGR